MRRIGGRKRAALAIVAAGLVGCRALGPIGAGGPSLVVPTYGYASGTASQGFARDRAEVEAALRDAMDELAIRREGPIDWDAERTVVHARTEDGHRAQVELIDRGAATEARVRIGLFGDEALSKAVLDRLGRRLGTLPPEATPAAAADSPSVPHFSRDAVPDAVMLRGFTEGSHTPTPTP